MQDQSLRQLLQVGDHHKYGKFRYAMVRGRYEAQPLLHQRRHQVHLIRWQVPLVDQSHEDEDGQFHGAKMVNRQVLQQQQSKELIHQHHVNQYRYRGFFRFQIFLSHFQQTQFLRPSL